MFSISINFGPAGTTWGLLFKTEERAIEVHAVLAADKTATVLDDFGQKFQSNSVHAMLLEDMNQSGLAHQARMLHDARIKANAQKAAQTDPQLRAVVSPQGPGIVTPFGPNVGMGR